MKKQVFGILFIVVIISELIFSLSVYAVHSNWQNARVSENIITQNSERITPSIWKTKKVSKKKKIKKAIKERKKYHRSLLQAYNKSFDPKYLDYIQKNSEKISQLRLLLN